jgi:hypothetical protein
MASIDKAEWHYLGNYPKELPPENGGTHIGVYLAWLINRDLGSARLRQLCGDKIDAVRRREMTGRALLFSELDEQLFDALLTKESRAFTESYYATNQYVNDYAALLEYQLGETESLYHLEDNWENYDRVAPQLDLRFAEWRAGQKK